jgi:hypothetical protein
VLFVKVAGTYDRIEDDGRCVFPIKDEQKMIKLALDAAYQFVLKVKTQAFFILFMC